MLLLLMCGEVSMNPGPCSTGIGGGVAFFIHESYTFENIVILISVSCRTLLLASIYHPPGPCSSIFLDEFTSFVCFLSRINTKIQNQAYENNKPIIINHYSYITNFQKFTKKFQCEKCSKIFKKIWHLNRHNAICYERTKYIFPGSFHKTRPTIFDKLESVRINISRNQKYFPYYIVWDMEAMLQKFSHLYKIN